MTSDPAAGWPLYTCIVWAEWILVWSPCPGCIASSFLQNQTHQNHLETGLGKPVLNVVWTGSLNQSQSRIDLKPSMWTYGQRFLSSATSCRINTGGRYPPVTPFIYPTRDKRWNGKWYNGSYTPICRHCICETTRKCQPFLIIARRLQQGSLMTATASLQT